MSRHIIISILLFIFILATPIFATPPLRIITNCHNFFIEPYCNSFTAKTGIKVEVNYVHNRIVSRVTLKPTEADIIITKTPFILPLFEDKGIIESLRDYGIDKDGSWLEYSYKLRVIYASINRVNNNDISDYISLADSKWKGRISIRSGYNEYNLQLFSYLYLEYGENVFINFIKGLKRNLNHPPRSNDRFQIKSICNNKADLVVASTHYRGIMNNKPSQKNCISHTKIIIPLKGAYKLPTCVAITKSNKSKKVVKIFIEGLLTDESQKMVSEQAFEYPLNNNFISEEVLSFTNGKFVKTRSLDFRQLANVRDKVIAILTDIGFDN